MRNWAPRAHEPAFRTHPCASPAMHPGTAVCHCGQRESQGELHTGVHFKCATLSTAYTVRLLQLSKECMVEQSAYSASTRAHCSSSVFSSPALLKLQPFRTFTRLNPSSTRITTSTDLGVLQKPRWVPDTTEQSLSSLRMVTCTSCILVIICWVM